MSYDAKCYLLAIEFLEDSNTEYPEMHEHAQALAQDIQDAVENYFEDNELQ